MFPLTSQGSSTQIGLKCGKPQVKVSQNRGQTQKVVVSSLLPFQTTQKRVVSNQNRWLLRVFVGFILVSLCNPKTVRAPLTPKRRVPTARHTPIHSKRRRRLEGWRLKGLLQARRAAAQLGQEGDVARPVGLEVRTGRREFEEKDLKGARESIRMGVENQGGNFGGKADRPFSTKRTSEELRLGKPSCPGGAPQTSKGTPGNHPSCSVTLEKKMGTLFGADHFWGHQKKKGGNRKMVPLKH